MSSDSAEAAVAALKRKARAQVLGGLARSRRQEMGLTQRELSKLSTMPVDAVLQIEQGEFAETFSFEWVRLAKALRWPVTFIADFLAGAVDETAVTAPPRPETAIDAKLTLMIRDAVFEALSSVAPDMPLSRFRKAERIALEVAKKHGYAPALGQPEVSADQTGEAPSNA